jgi:hypothetical protein
MGFIAPAWNSGEATVIAVRSVDARRPLLDIRDWRVCVSTDVYGVVKSLWEKLGSVVAKSPVQ